jgi:nitrogen fixation NifU-like protein
MQRAPLPYSKEIIKHFRRPRNVGRIRNPSGVGRAGNLLCGDVLYLYLKIKGDRIVDARFQTFGCITAVANSSILTTMIKGKTLKQALEISKEDLLRRIGKPLPPLKVHCSILAADALYEALYDYYKREGLPIPEKLRREHKRIQRTFRIISQKYRQFIKLEEEALKA